uniref:Uncharacterized protein n=1 Tax=Amphilophus citrinellus TaxID=61819 RepID=A0A3Q0S209_AMPCI
MSIDFITLTFIWLLPVTANNAVTSDQNKVSNNVPTTVITEESFTHNKRSSSEEITATKTTQQRSQTVHPNTILPTAQTTSAPTSSPLPHLTRTSMGSLTEVQPTVIKSTMTVLTSQASNLATKPTSTPLVLSSSTQSREKTLSTQVMRQSPHPSTISPESTNLISTTNTSTTPKEDKSESTSPAAGDDIKQPRDVYKISTSIPITKERKRQTAPEKKENSKNGTTHGKIVSGVIGGSLLLMMVGFLVIFIKKRKLQKQQVTTTDWAGPSPFLEGGADNGQVTLRSSNRISLASFLPLRLSKRLSLLPETDEELKDMTPATTFGDKNQGATFGQAVDGNAGPESNQTTAVPERILNFGLNLDPESNQTRFMHKFSLFICPSSRFQVPIRISCHI